MCFIGFSPSYCPMMKFVEVAKVDTLYQGTISWQGASPLAVGLFVNPFQKYKF